MPVFQWVRLCVASVVIATSVFSSAVSFAQQGASAVDLVSAPGLPGKASQTRAPAVKYVPTDPKMAITSAPAVSLVEHAGTAGLKALDAALDIVAPWSAAPGPLEHESRKPTIFGKDDRVKVTNTTTYPYNVVCSLEMTFPNGKVFIGSGAFISYQTVLTAGHCVYDKANGGWARSIKVMPGRNGSSLPYGYGYATGLNSVTGWTKNGDRAYDYGTINMGSKTLGNKVGYLGYAVRSDSTLTQTTYNTAGFPGDKGGTTMWYTNGKISSVSRSNLYYYFDIKGGQSGSAIWDSNRYVVGIVSAEYTDGSGPNIATRINQDVFNFIKSQP